MTDVEALAHHRLGFAPATEPEQGHAGLTAEHRTKPPIQPEPPGVLCAPRRYGDRLLETVGVHQALGEAVRREQQPLDATGVGGRLTRLRQPLDRFTGGAGEVESVAQDREGVDLDRTLTA